MFSSELNLINNPQSDFFSFQFNPLEFQYQLCSIFLKKTGQQLYKKQANLMLQSKDLMKKLIQRDIQKDACTSTDSGSQQLINNPQYELTQDNNKIRSTKRGDAAQWKKNQERLATCLLEIQQKCSPLCSTYLKSILNDCHNLGKRLWQIQVFEGMVQRKQVHFQREHEENIILKQKINTQNLKIQTMQCEIDCLKQKNQTVIDYANQRLKEMMGNKKLIQINSKVFKEIRNYLDDKEKNIAFKLQRVQSLQNDLLNHISSILPKNSCSNCCLILRKLKDSLISFKQYLEKQQNQLQELYSKYKKTIFSQRNNKN